MAYVVADRFRWRKLAIVRRSEEELPSVGGARYIVQELGFRQANRGLLVTPTEQVKEVDVDRLRELVGCSKVGKWFPCDIHAERDVFVLDDDGSIVVSTVNLPNELRAKACSLIREFADILYDCLVSYP